MTPIISVDDHLIEPPDVFEGRVPAALADRAPRIEVRRRRQRGVGVRRHRHPQVGLNAVAGRPKAEWSMEPGRFDEMRRGCYDIEARVADMDLDGVYASLCFPSLIAGFAGTIFAKQQGPRARPRLRCGPGTTGTSRSGRARTRSVHPAAARVAARSRDRGRRRARATPARGFKAVSFPENPVDLGLPSMHTDHWDPFLAACEETGTVVCLHNGSSSWTAARSPGAPLELLHDAVPGERAGRRAPTGCGRGVPVRFPELAICLAEGGIGWVPMLHRPHRLRARPLGRRVRAAGTTRRRTRPTRCAATSGSARSTSRRRCVLRDHIGIDHICIESDYPHADSTWPDTRAGPPTALADLPADEAERICWRNAAELFSLGSRPCWRTRDDPASYVDPENRGRPTPTRPEVAADPVPFYRELREHVPVASLGPAGHARHQPLRGREVRAPAPGDLQLGHHARSTSARHRPLIPLQIDPPEHAKYRRVMDPHLARPADGAPRGAGAGARERADRRVHRARELRHPRRVLRAAAVHGVPAAVRLAARSSSTRSSVGRTTSSGRSCAIRRSRSTTTRSLPSGTRPARRSTSSSTRGIASAGHDPRRRRHLAVRER